MTYQRKTDNPNAGRPKGEPKQSLTIRLPVEQLEAMRKVGPVRQVAIQSIRAGLPGIIRTRII
jgi:hypothetical protein